MTTLGGYYVAPHRSQYAPTESHITHTSGCTWTSGANGANNANGKSLDGDAVHAKVANSEETNPGTPGWTLADLDLAMARLAIPFGIGQGGWPGVRAARAGGLYVVLQGDSSVFTSGCSGTFDGDHAIGIHPATDGLRWWINDPICPDGRWEDETVLHRYAARLNAGILFGVFTTKVPRPVTHYALHIAHNAVVRTYSLGANGCIARPWVDEKWTGRASTAACAMPVNRRTCAGTSSATTTKVATGKYRGKTIRVGAGVTVSGA
jgi:hypothetical protein